MSAPADPRNADRTAQRPPLRRAAGVVGFLARSRDRLLLSRRLAKWRDAPSPETLSDAVQTLLRLDDVEKAFTIAREGEAKFKGDPLVRELWRIAARAHAELSYVAAQAEIESNPSAAAYLRVARCAVLLRDSDAAMRALEECLRRYPTAALAHAAMSELLEQRWQRDLAAADARAALTHLRKAWRLDGTDPARPLRLAVFLARIGAVREALRVADELLQLHEDHTEANALRGSLSQVVEARLADGTLAPNEHDDIEALLRQVEESGRVAADPGDEVRVGRESARLLQALAALRTRTRCEQALVIEPNGDALDERGLLGSCPLGGLATNLVRSAQMTVRRLDLGPLLAAEMETAGGTLLLHRAQRCFVGALFDQPETGDDARTVLGEVAAGRLTPRPAPAPKEQP